MPLGHNLKNTISKMVQKVQSSWAIIFRILFSKCCTFGSKSGTKSLVRRYQAKFAITPLINTSNSRTSSTQITFRTQIKIEFACRAQNFNFFFFIRAYRNITQKVILLILNLKDQKRPARKETINN